MFICMLADVVKCCLNPLCMSKKGGGRPCICMNRERVGHYKYMVCRERKRERARVLLCIYCICVHSTLIVYSRQVNARETIHEG